MNPDLLPSTSTQPYSIKSYSELAAEALHTTSAKEHARSLGLAAIRAIPVIGGALASLLNDYLPN